MSNAADLDTVLREAGQGAGWRRRRLYNSRLWLRPGAEPAPGAAGPVIGAPYAVMLLETLAAWGARQVLYIGWCGAVDGRLDIGDVLVPTDAIVDEGTSPAYGVAPGARAAPDPAWTERIRRKMAAADLALRHGTVWTTDAVFRETPARVAHFRSQGALAVEMEVSALCSAARHLEVALAAVLVVSDTLAEGGWRPGFRSPRFTRRRQAVCRVASGLLQAPSPAGAPGSRDTPP